MKPRVGEVRLYDGVIAVLYPGERAHAIVDVGECISALADRGLTEMAVTQWLVEPEPGLMALYRRWRYRLVGQWMDSWQERMSRCDTSRPS